MFYMSPPGKQLPRVLSVVHLGAILEQQFHQVQIAVFGGEMERRVAALVGGVDVGAAHQQQLRGLGVTLPDGVVQGPEALGDRLVGLGAAREQDADLVERLQPYYRVGQLPLQRVGDALGRHLLGGATPVKETQNQRQKETERLHNGLAHSAEKIYSKTIDRRIYRYVTCQRREKSLSLNFVILLLVATEREMRIRKFKNFLNDCGKHNHSGYIFEEAKTF